MAWVGASLVRLWPQTRMPIREHGARLVLVSFPAVVLVEGRTSSLGHHSWSPSKLGLWCLITAAWMGAPWGAPVPGFTNPQVVVQTLPLAPLSQRMRRWLLPGLQQVQKGGSSSPCSLSWDAPACPMHWVRHQHGFLDCPCSWVCRWLGRSGSSAMTTCHGGAKGEEKGSEGRRRPEDQ